MSEASELGIALDGARIAGMFPYLQAELTAMEAACITRMDSMMTNGTMTPELAQMAWIELIGYRRLRRRFEAKIRISQSVGERNVALLSGEPPLPI